MRLAFVLSLIMISLLVATSSAGKKKPPKPPTPKPPKPPKPTKPCYMPVKKVAAMIALKMWCIIDFDTDLLHIIDSSGSMSDNEFNSAKSAAQFVNNILHWLQPIGLGGSRVGLTKFGEPFETYPRFHLSDFNTLALNNLHVGLQIHDKGSQTATAHGLWWGMISYFWRYSTNQKLMWVFLDGQTNTGGDPAVPAQWLKDMGVIICCMAIGPNINWAEINRIASPGCVCWMRNAQLYKKAAKLAFSKVKKMAKKKGKKKCKAGHK